MIYLHKYFTGVIIIGFTSNANGNLKGGEVSLSDGPTENSKGKIYHDYISVDSSEEDYAEDYTDNRAGNIWPNTDEVINHEPNIDQYKVTEEQTNIGQHWHMLERNECDRVCSKNEIPKTCHFKFIIEQHTSMGKACYDCPMDKNGKLNLKDCFRPHCITADGYERGLITINRTMPGPPVVVCKNDKVIVDVLNALPADTTSIHFHGQHHRDGYQYYDGVPYVTQCPIYPGLRFRYQHIASVSGTGWYHSHTNLQRAQGLFGMNIVRQAPEDEPHSRLYDYDLTEHLIIIQEWFHGYTRDDYLLQHWNRQHEGGETLIINGKGRFFEESFQSNDKYNKTDNKLTENVFEKKKLTRLPMATFFVTPGNRYRFRAMQPGFTLCPVLVSIDDHEMTIIASDTGSLRPQKAKSFVIYAGERFDFVLNANQHVKFENKRGRHGTYYKHNNGVFKMRFQGLQACALDGVIGEALLVYNKFGSHRQDSEIELAEVFEHSSKRPHSSKSYERYIQERDDLYLPIIQPLQYAKGWKRDGFLSMADLKSCFEKTCLSHPDASSAECEWLTPTDQDNVLKCADGTYCNWNYQDNDCCSDHNGRARCPKNQPTMCAKKTCVNGPDYCCASNSTSCEEDFGGPRICYGDASSAECEWLTSTDQDNVLKCTDGTYCNWNGQGDDCCSDHNGRARCPKNQPTMCAKKTCVDGSDYCCALNSTSCQIYSGGPRICHTDTLRSCCEKNGVHKDCIGLCMGTCRDTSQREYEKHLGDDQMCHDYMATAKQCCKDDVITDVRHDIGETDPALKEKIPDKTFYISFDVHGKENPHYDHPQYYPYEASKRLSQPQIDHISFKLTSSPILTEPDHDRYLCNEDTFKKDGKDCKKEWCECPYTLKVEKGDVVEIFLIDEGFDYDVTHPMHLHGYSFYVLAMERHGKNNSNVGLSDRSKGNRITKQKVIDLNNAGKIERNLKNPPLKDTVIVPDAGFTLIRFLADNPGFWLLHCHISWHHRMGMAMMLQVGNREDIESPVPDGFPTCGDYGVGES